MNNLQKKNPTYGHKKKAAIISIALNVLLTFFKFVIYAFSGSIVILAEAWHSFSDIVTSFAIYFAISKDLENKKAVNTDHDSKILRIIKSVFPFIKMEYAISFFIGIFMLFVSISIDRKSVV